MGDESFNLDSLLDDLNSAVQSPHDTVKFIPHPPHTGKSPAQSLLHNPKAKFAVSPDESFGCSKSGERPKSIPSTGEHLTLPHSIDSDETSLDHLLNLLDTPHDNSKPASSYNGSPKPSSTSLPKFSATTSSSTRAAWEPNNHNNLSIPVVTSHKPEKDKIEEASGTSSGCGASTVGLAKNEFLCQGPNNNGAVASTIFSHSKTIPDDSMVMMVNSKSSSSKGDHRTHGGDNGMSSTSNGNDAQQSKSGDLPPPTRAFGSGMNSRPTSQNYSNANGTSTGQQWQTNDHFLPTATRHNINFSTGSKSPNSTSKHFNSSNQSTSCDNGPSNVVSSISSNAKLRCSRVVLAGTATTRGRKASAFSKNACDNLRCLQCNFSVHCFPGRKWDNTVDYMFLRNTVPNEAKLALKLQPSQNSYAYCCQCSSADESDERLLTQGAEGDPQWICAGH